MPTVVYRSGDDATHDDDDALDGTNPGDGVGGDIREDVLIVGLVGAVGAEQAPGRHVDEEAADGLHPGIESLILGLAI